MAASRSLRQRIGAALAAIPWPHVRITLRSAYRAAERGRLERDWPATTSTADAALIPEISVLIARARDIVRNDPFGRSATRAFVRNVVGSGITPNPVVQKADGTPDVDWNSAVSRSFRRWATSPSRVDRERKRNFALVQAWACREEVQAGGGFVVMSEELQPDGTTDLVLQCLEYEQLDGRLTKYVDPETRVEREVRKGVEVDECGAAVAYHFVKPGPLGSPAALEQTQRVTADRVCHVFDPQRACQSLGETRFAPALRTMWHLSEFDYAHLVAARAEASLGFGIESQDAGEDDDETDADGNKKPRKAWLELGPFSVFRARPGEKLVSFTPTRPGALYEPYVKAQVRRIAAALGLSYEVVARDHSTSNYSGLRQGGIEDRREYAQLQQLLVVGLCTRVYRRKVEIDVVNGRLRPPVRAWASDREHFLACQWMPDGWEWIDPQAEATAFETALQNNTTTLAEVHGERGRDWRQQLAQRVTEEAEEARLREAAGLPPKQAAPAAPAGAGAP